MAALHKFGLGKLSPHTQFCIHGRFPLRSLQLNCIPLMVDVVSPMAPNQSMHTKFLYESRCPTVEQPTSSDNLLFSMEGEKADAVPRVPLKCTISPDCLVVTAEVEANSAGSNNAPLVPS
jgi:hypothetical protein